MGEVAEIAVKLVEAVEDDTGRTPQRIIVEPNGALEVNCRVGFREQTHPQVYFQRREEDQ